MSRRRHPRLPAGVGFYCRRLLRDWQHESGVALRPDLVEGLTSVIDRAYEDGFTDGYGEAGADHEAGPGNPRPRALRPRGAR